MKNKAILLPVAVILVCALILFGVSAGLSARREAIARTELTAKMQAILPGSAEFTEEAYTGEDENIARVYKAENGYVIETCVNGYADTITMLVGVNNEGTVTGLQIRDMHETIGLGSQALNDADFLVQLVNSQGELAVGENVDAISGATVTSKAIVRSVNSASAYVTGADISSSATTWGG